MSLQVFTTRKDIERVIEIVIERMSHSEFIHTQKVEYENDRLSQKQAAEFLGVSVVTLIQWKKKGAIPYYQIATKPFYSKRELLEFSRKNRGLSER